MWYTFFENPLVCNSLKSFNLGMTGNENAFIVCPDSNQALCQILLGSSAELS
jgi:hypothetical protein